MDKKYFLTLDKYNTLKKELAELQSTAIKDLSDKLAEIRNETVGEMEDPFSAIEEDKLYVQKRIDELDEILENSTIIDESEKHNIAEIGSSVRVGFDTSEDIFMLVDPLEADPINKKISIESIVGKALLGRKVGDIIEINVFGINKRYRILGID